MPPIISVENLGKKYRIGGKPSSHGLRHQLEEVFSKPYQWLKKFNRHQTNLNSSSVEDFWALKEVSFEVERGDVLGIIGRNGAGKSTLLKILSRITEPTEGRITIRGRVASLLEVGTGFHPELTGRENIFLNGAILGMTRAEIKNKFDEIVAFAEIEKFIDTPVKRYSSGMYVRLAFAVAAHLEPEILVVDEVLAVGDAEFQKKCLGKMEDVSKKEGRTVIFVSHNLSSLKSLCRFAVMLERGKLKYSGDIDQVLNKYTDQKHHGIAGKVELDKWTKSNLVREYISLLEVELRNYSGKVVNIFEMGKTQEIYLKFEILKKAISLQFEIYIQNLDGVYLHILFSRQYILPNDYEKGGYQLKVIIPKVILYPGRYQLSVLARLSGNKADDGAINCITFDVISNNFMDGKINFAMLPRGCQTYVDHKWSLL